MGGPAIHPGATRLAAFERMEEPLVAVLAGLDEPDTLPLITEAVIAPSGPSRGRPCSADRGSASNGLGHAGISHDDAA